MYFRCSRCEEQSVKRRGKLPEKNKSKRKHERIVRVSIYIQVVCWLFVVGCSLIRDPAFVYGYICIQPSLVIQVVVGIEKTAWYRLFACARVLTRFSGNPGDTTIHRYSTV